MEATERWCSNHKLILSKEKTVALMLKGKFDRERRPRIPFLDTHLKFKDEVTYLGVLLTEGLSITAHAKYVANKAKIVMNNMAGVTKSNWGVGYRELLKIFRGAFVPVITYAASAWALKLNKAQIRIFKASQRKAATRCIRAYNTISEPAALVIAGMPNIMYTIEQAILRYQHKKG